LNPKPEPGNLPARTTGSTHI